MLPSACTKSDIIPATPDTNKGISIFLFLNKKRVSKLTRFYLAGEEGFEPSHAGIKIQCLNRLTTPQQRDLAGEEGFEPSHAGIKIQCLNRLTTPQQRDLAGEEGFEPSHAGIKIQCLNRLTTPQQCLTRQQRVYCETLCQIRLI